MSQYMFPPINFTGHHDVIFDLVKLLDCNRYLELGIDKGELIHKISQVVPNCYGVDIADNRTIKDVKYTFLNKSTNEFFDSNKDRFDIIFIDADHNIKACRRDFENALKCINNDGIILIHDVDPMTPKYSNRWFCYDSYKIIDYIEQKHKELNYINLPITVAGLLIVTQKNNDTYIVNDPMNLILDIVRLTNCTKYLELCIGTGDLIDKISDVVKNCTGLDNNDNRMKTNNKYNFINGSIDDFFLNISEKFDIIFINSCQDDFENSLKCLSFGGIILIPVSNSLIQYIEQKQLNYVKLAGLLFVTRKNETRVDTWKN